GQADATDAILYSVLRLQGSDAWTRAGDHRVYFIGERHMRPYSYANFHSNANADPDPDPNSNAHGDSYPHSDINAHSHAHVDREWPPNALCDANADSNRNATFAGRHTFGHAHVFAKPNVGPRLRWRRLLQRRGDIC